MTCKLVKIKRNIEVLVSNICKKNFKTKFEQIFLQSTFLIVYDL